MKNGTYDMREDAKSLGKLQDRLNTPCVKLGKPAPKFVELNKTRPDTRQSSRGRLGRSSNAKTARNSKM